MGRGVTSENYLDKMQIASVRLADTIYGFFSGNHPATTIDGARAVSEVLSGVKQYLHKSKAIDNTELEFEEKDDEFMLELKRKSNFTKHADRDTNRVAEMSEKLSYVALRTTVMDYQNLMHELIDKGMVVPDEQDGDWRRTAYGSGNSTLILCNLFDLWDRDGFGLDIAMEHQDEAFFSVLSRTFDPHAKDGQDEDMAFVTGKMAHVLNQIQDRRVSNSDLEVKRQWRDVADDLMLWPVPHSGGLKLARDKGLEFKHLDL